MHSSDDAIAVLDDAQIAMAIESYVAAERFTVGADYGRYDGDVFFVDAMLEMDLWASRHGHGGITSPVSCEWSRWTAATRTCWIRTSWSSWVR